MATLILLGVSSAIISRLFTLGLLPEGPDRSGYRQLLLRASTAHASYTAIGNSIAEGVNPGSPPTPVHLPPSFETFHLVVQGSSPRTDLWLFNRVQFRCIRPGSLVMFYLTPLDLSRENELFHMTIASYFSWKEFFTDLLPHGRFAEATFFLTNCSVPLINHRYELRRLIHTTLHLQPLLDVDAAEVRRLDAEREAMRLRVLSHYAIDAAEADAVLKVLRGLQQRRALPIVVLLPWGPGFRGMPAPHVSRFLNTVHTIVAQTGTPLLDYTAVDQSQAYQYVDAFHLTTASKAKLNQVLGADVRRILSHGGS